MSSFQGFEAPCVLQNNREIVGKNGEVDYFSGLFFCRPAGQGKSMLIVRFGSTRRSPLTKIFPKWYLHQNGTPFHCLKGPAIVEHAPAGLVARISASSPAKGGMGTMHAPDVTNRYFPHVIHCKECRSAVKAFQLWKKGLSIVALVSTGMAILMCGRQWKALLLISTTLCLAGIYACSSAIAINTTNFIRIHRRL
ncbi:hypothetical protein F0562_012143 [Nyssa sinensis]|uniref:Pheophorbide a oxygenase domain-containing protein n=1 Tax=Nyssa sinensis TaxID=561372 RepID=A0A5J4ZSP8_9ASTE|nr:hypothetical protein F0562_012143 [Nyssa sinensis]